MGFFKKEIWLGGGAFLLAFLVATSMVVFNGKKYSNFNFLKTVVVEDPPRMTGVYFADSSGQGMSSGSTVAIPYIAYLVWSASNADRVSAFCTGLYPISLIDNVGLESSLYGNFGYGPIMLDATGYVECTFTPYLGAISGSPVAVRINLKNTSASVYGKCGSATGESSCQAPTTNLCENSTPTTATEMPDGSSRWIWYCYVPGSEQKTSCVSQKVCAVPACSIKFTQSKTDKTAITVAKVGETKGFWSSVSSFDSTKYDAWYNCALVGGGQFGSDLANHGETGNDWKFNSAGDEQCFIGFYNKGVSPNSTGSNAVSYCGTDKVNVSLASTSTLNRDTINAATSFQELTESGSLYVLVGGIKTLANKVLNINNVYEYQIDASGDGNYHGTGDFAFVQAFKDSDQYGAYAYPWGSSNYIKTLTKIQNGSTPTPTPASAVCGNGIKEGAESCDVGNGASDNCAVFGGVCSATTCQCVRSAPTSNPTPTKTPATTPTSTPTFLQGDLNKDRKVDIYDYNLLVTNFGKKESGNIADIDKDGDVDIYDYNLLITNFGKSN